MANKEGHAEDVHQRAPHVLAGIVERDNLQDLVETDILAEVRILAYSQGTVV